MFHSARLKLTVWYLFIIMAISISFSAFIYFGATRELDRVLRVEEFRTQHPELGEVYIQRPVWQTDTIPLPRPPDPQLIEATRIRVLEGLVGINLIVLILSALAGYFLAGRTLRPIKNMVDEQNRFITDASHELSTPLTSLKTSIEVNLRDKTLNLEKAKKALESNLEEVNNLQVLSDELIKITQYEKPNGNFSFEKVLLPEIIEAAIQKVSPQAKNKNIKITIKTPKLEILGDKRGLTELLTILLDNAVKYSPDKKSVKIKVDKIDSKARIVIEDEGFGIKKEDLPHIFDRFYRSDKSRTKQNVTGYGLGLSIAKRIAGLHNGTIDVVSIVNKGTKFTIHLPMA